MNPGEKHMTYNALARQAVSLLRATRNPVSNAANLAALIYDSLTEINWVGFYFVHGDELMVGPFQGKPACVRIPVGQGVCGTAVSSRRVQRVADVEAFDGHIVCDTESRSEIVVPLIQAEEVIGVLDVDSPRLDRFDETDQAGMEKLAAIYLDSIAPK